MSTDNYYNLGDIIEIGTTFRINGVLTSPTTVTAYVKSWKDNVTTTYTDAADAEVTIGVGGGESQAVSDAVATEIGITAAENQAGTGIVRVRFVADVAGKWGCMTQGEGAAQGTSRRVVQCIDPAADYTYAGTDDIT